MQIKTYILSSILFFLAQNFVVGQNLFINEIMSSNASTIADENGDYSDWIELFNAGNSPISLSGWGLSDNKSNPLKWKFPDITLQQGQHLLVWASGKDRKPVPGQWINGLMRDVYTNIPGTSINNLINHPSYPDHPAKRQIITDRFEAPYNTGDNYGQRVHGLIKAPATGNYTFWISSDDNGQLWLSTDETMANLRHIASIPGWTNSREWLKYPEQKSAEIFLEEGKHYYIMALMKEGVGGDNLAVGWQLPDGTLDRPVSGKYLFTQSSELHTNFSISAAGEALILVNLQGEIVDEMPPVEIPSDISYGRKPDGGALFGFFSEPTPGSSNATEIYSEALSAPVFSHEGGFYSNPFQLSLSSTHQGATIIYSVDGSLPVEENLSPKTFQYLNQYRETPGSSAGIMQSGTFRSNIYISPIEVKDPTSDPNKVSRISTTYNSNPWYFPSQPIDKAVVIKARVVKDGALASPVVSHTYFVRSGGSNPYTLPVISMSAQMDHLFDFNRGIYVAGTDFEKWRSANPMLNADGGRPANYHREGDEWEYPAHIELFEPSGFRAFGQNIGFRLHGGWSRSHPFKSVRLYARNSYGGSHLDYPFFSDLPYDAYRRIILRNSGNDTWYTMFRDAFLQEMVRHMNFETMAYQPSILFLNGEYWGIHNIRERFDQYYLSRRFGVAEDQVDILEGNMRVDQGDNQHYAETIDYINIYGLKDDQHYDYIKTRIDVTSFIDYMLSQIFMVNTDWPGNNIKFWRRKTPAYMPEEGPGLDGRWRWMMFDTDFGFGIYTPTDYTKNMLTFATEANGPNWPNPPWSTFLFRKLLENESFRTDFIIRFSDQLNTALKTDVVQAIIDRMRAVIEPEMGRHIQRYRIPSSLANWNSNVNIMRDFAVQRPIYMRTHLRQFFNLAPDYTLTVDVSDKTHGHVVVNTIPILGETAGVDNDPYPWRGTYFRKVPLRLEAIPAPGYEFVRWIPAVTGYTNRVIELQPDANQQFIAVFRKMSRSEEVVHYWNFNQTDKLLIPTFTIYDAALQTQLPDGGIAEITNGTGQDFSGLNARFGDGAGSHLRVNNPIGVVLVFDLPTSGFSRIQFRYETRRSGQGAGIQIVEYSVNGTDFTEIKRLSVKDADPVVVSLDFSDIVAVNNNADFKIRIRFEQGDGGTAGNNRFDNITLEGVPDEGLNLPPVVARHPGEIYTIENTGNIKLSLSEVFRDPEGQPLNYTVDSRHSEVISPSLEGNSLVLKVLQRGESMVQVTASDGVNNPVGLIFRVLVYPEAFRLSDGEFEFTSWNNDAPEMTFPEHMIFLQSNKNDPGINDPLDYAYYIEPGEYGADDTGNIGYPYRNSSRTRINGLDGNGISFINTGRGRDLGGALLALNTEGVSEFGVGWLAGTILRNSRKYGISLQYRIGFEGDFIDLPRTLYEALSDGHTAINGSYLLPQELAGKEYVQLLWRYHHIDGTSGARAQLRLDDILVAAHPVQPQIIQPLAGSTATTEQKIEWAQVPGVLSYELQVAYDPEFINPVFSLQGLALTEYLMDNLASGMDYYIRVRAFNSLFTGEWSETVSFTTRTTSAGIVAGRKSFIQVYPNPFGDNATVNVNLMAGGQVLVGLYDLTGKKMMNVYNGLMPSGEFTFRIEGSHLPAGTYILICQTSQGISREKMVKF